MAGFTNDSNGDQIMYTDNVDFTGSATPSATVTMDGQLLIGSSVAPNIRVNTLTAGAGISITNGEGTITIASSGGSTNVDSFAMQSGTSPVVPDTTGLVTFSGGTAAAGTNPVITVGGTNTMTLTVQRSQAIAATDATKIGLAAFDSAAFSVDANGFVTLAGGTQAIDSIGVDATSGGGTNPVLPTVAGLVTVNGARVAAGTNPVRTVSTAANVYQVQVQTSQAIAATDATKVGLANFDSAKFTVDANGFVSTSGTGVGNTITGDSGGALSPTAGNWNILGQQASSIPVMITTGSGSTLNVEDRTWVTKFVVDPSSTTGLRGTYTTIAAAITAAGAGPADIMIRPGTYTENITLPATINLYGQAGADMTPLVTLVGKITCTDAGRRTVSNMRLSSNADFIVSVTGSAATVVMFKFCYLNISSTTGINFTSSSSSADVSFYYTEGFITGNVKLFDATSPGNLSFHKCNINSTSWTGLASTTSATYVSFLYTIFQGALAASSSGYYQIIQSYINANAGNVAALALTGTGVSTSSESFYASGTATAITVGAGTSYKCQNIEVFSSNTDAISGAGTIEFADISHGHQAGNINVTTKNLNQFSVGKETVYNTLEVGADSYGTAGTGYVSYVKKNQNALTGFQIENANNNAAAQTRIVATSSTVSGSLRAWSPTFTTDGGKFGLVADAGASELVLRCDNVSANMTFSPNGNVASGTMSCTGAGGDNTFTWLNASNTASSQAKKIIQVAGGTAGDAFQSFIVNGVTTWSQGLDNSDSDAYVIAASATLGTTNVARCATAGQWTYPLQPAFNAYNSTDRTGQTKGIDVTLTFDTEVFDRGNNFSSNTFTAPVTGLYQFNVSVAIFNYNSATRLLLKLTVAGQDYELSNTNPSNTGDASGTLNQSGSVLISMSASDTAVAKVFVSGGTSTYAICGTTFRRTYFSGYLVA